MHNILRYAKFAVMCAFCFIPGCKGRQTIKGEGQWLSVDTVKPAVYKHNSVWPSVATGGIYRQFDTIHLEGQVYFLTEGDVLLTRQELLLLMAKRTVTAAIDSLKPLEQYENQMIIITYDDVAEKIIKWDSFPIRFCIHKQSFKNVQNGYETVRQNFLAAINDWESVCGVKFEYLEALDESPNKKSGNVHFVIQYYEPAIESNYIASAFFPNDAENKRKLLVYPNYWETAYDKVGLFRHEIGHIFGFRHEHSSKIGLVPLDCNRRYGEDAAPHLAMSDYDIESVMHYFCGGAGTRAMRFSQNDTLAFKEVYPKP